MREPQESATKAPVVRNLPDPAEWAIGPAQWRIQPVEAWPARAHARPGPH